MRMPFTNEVGNHEVSSLFVFDNGRRRVYASKV